MVALRRLSGPGLPLRSGRFILTHVTRLAAPWFLAEEKLDVDAWSCGSSGRYAPREYAAVTWINSRASLPHVAQTLPLPSRLRRSAASKRSFGRSARTAALLRTNWGRGRLACRLVTLRCWRLDGGVLVTTLLKRLPTHWPVAKTSADGCSTPCGKTTAKFAHR